MTFGIVLAIVLLNLFLSFRILKDGDHAAAQLLLLWLVPILGAIILIAVSELNEEHGFWPQLLGVGGLIVVCVTFGHAIPEYAAWRMLPAQPTVEQADAYLVRYPKGAHADLVRKKLEAAQWESSQRGNGEGDYRAYCERVPDGAHAAEARSRWESLAWTRIGASFSADDYTWYLKQFAQGPHRCDAAIAIARNRESRTNLQSAVGECHANAAAASWPASRLANIDARDQDAYIAARVLDSPDAFAQYLHDFPDGRHAREIADRADIAEQRDAAYDIARLVMLARTRPALPRRDAQLIIIDENPHATLVGDAAGSQFRGGKILLLPMSDSLIKNLHTIVQWKVDHPGVDVVVNMSWGSHMENPLHDRLFALLATAGIVFVAAVGNDGERSIMFPAAYDAVIGVGSVKPNRLLTEYTNFGDGLDVCLVDRSDEARGAVMRDLFETIASERCAETRGLYHGFMEKKERFARAATRYFEKKIEEQHIASGTSLASGAFSGYLIRQLRTQPDASIESIVAPFRRGGVPAILPIEFGTGRFDARYDCNDIAGIMRTMIEN